MIFAAFILGVGIIFCLWYTRERDCNVSIPVILYSDSAQNYALNGTESTLHMEGTVKKNLFSHAVFSGEIWLDGMEEMRNGAAKEHIIEDGHMDYCFAMGREDETALSNMYIATMYWNEENTQVVLRVLDNERSNFVLEGFVAVGPYRLEEGTADFWNEDGLLKHLLAAGEPVYSEWALPDAFYDAQKQEFVFLQQQIDRAVTSDFADFGAETIKDFYILYASFTGTSLAFDQVEAQKNEETEKMLEVSFRFRSREEYKQGLAEFESALDGLPEEVLKENYVGTLRLRYEVSNEGGNSYLEVLAYPEQYQFDVRIGMEGKTERGLGY